MIDYNILKRLANVFHILANYMTSYSGDLFIDFPRACDIAMCSRPVVVFVHKTHADLMERYDYGGASFDSCVHECQRTLGLDFAIEIEVDKITIHNYKADKWAIDDIVSRLKEIPQYREGDTIKVIGM